MSTKREERRRAPAPTWGRPGQPRLQGKPRILLVCEGQNTEPSYFEQLQAQFNSFRLVPVGTGYNRVSLVKKAIQLRQEDDYAEVWCVFDKDEDLPKGSFANAIQLAESSGLQVAWSNQAFEFWLLLHFNAHAGGGLHRDRYHSALQKVLSPLAVKYEGRYGKVVTADLFQLLQARQAAAIKHSHRIYTEKQVHGILPTASESCTVVHKLLQALLKREEKGGL